MSDGEAPEADRLLQLRLRAGATEDPHRDKLLLFLADELGIEVTPELLPVVNAYLERWDQGVLDATAGWVIAPAIPKWWRDIHENCGGTWTPVDERRIGPVIFCSCEREA